MAATAPLEAQPTNEQLAQAIAELKAEETKLSRERTKLEIALVSRFDRGKEEGSITHTLDDGAKVTITTRLNRSVDWEIYDSIESEVPPKLRPIKRALDTTGCKWIERNEPGVWAIIAPAITTKPGKPTVTVKGAE